MDVDVGLGPFSVPHGFGHSHILSVPLPDNDVVRQVSVLATRRHPCCSVVGGEAEDSVCDKKFVLYTSLKKD